MLQQLRVIAAIATEAERAAPVGFRHWSPVTVTARVVLGLAAGKTLVAVAGVVGVWGLPLTAERWPFSANLLLFGLTGAMLVAGSSRDRRLESLGTLYLVIASAFADRLLPLSGERLAAAAAGLRYIPTDAFTAYALWLFVWVFPAVPADRRTRRLASIGVAVAGATGVVLMAIAVLRAWGLWAPGSTGAAALAAALDRHEPTSAYWPLQFAQIMPAIPFLIWKSRRQRVADRRRVALFLMGLIGGLLPMLVAVLAAPLVPALRDPGWRDAVGLLLYLALAFTVLGTVYAISVDEVMNLHLVVQRTMQYRLARHVVWIASLAPLAFLALDIYRWRDLTLVDYFGGRLIGPLLLSAGALSLLTFRHQILTHVDRWFERNPADFAEALARTERGLRAARSLRDVAVILTGEIELALHPTAAAMFVGNGTHAAFVPVGSEVPPPPRQSAILEILASTRSEIQIVFGIDDALTRLLPQPDRDWLAETGLECFAPMIGSNGLFGLVGIGPARNGLPYTRRDHLLLTAVSGQAALQIENTRLREEHHVNDAPDGGVRGWAPTVDWQNEPAALCPACGLTWPPDTRHCGCGTATVAAPLPLLVNGKFRIERLLGAGGTGVVYLAVDMALDRKVAIKTLPAMNQDYVRRLHREARAMAAVRHPNLALIYGAEHWRGTPLLIVEYLEGGTLLEWLRRGSVAIDEAIDLGIVLADVLDRVHSSGVLHRDIKPSNIGYTADGLPKLLDFGLASILHRSITAAASRIAAPADVAQLLEQTSPASSLTITQQLVGTPLYMSPEALAGSPPDASFDLWGLSLVLYEVLAGRHPFGGGTVADVVARVGRGGVADIRDRRPECPADLAAFLGDALSPVASRRPQSAGALRNRLRVIRTNRRTVGS